MDNTRTEHWRKTLTAASMILAPVSFFVGDALWPVTHTKAADMLDDAVGNTGRVAWSLGFALLGFALMAAAIVGLAHLLRERRPAVALAGAGVGLAGIVAASAITGVFGMVMFEAAQPGRNAPAMVGFMADLFEGSVVPLGVAAELFAIGLVILGVGLVVARVAPMWTGAGIAIAAVLMGIGQPYALKPLILVGEAVLFLGLGAVGLMVLAETDTEWEHTPEFHGRMRGLAAH